MKAILTYHSIDASGSVISVDRETLREHAAWLARAGLYAVDLERLLALPDGVPGVAITFDDAFANFATEAWPVLHEFGHAATLFVPTGHVGGTNAWEANGRQGVPVLPLLDWAALGRLASEGLILGSHGVAHTRLTSASESVLREEVEASAVMVFRETGVDPATFAYPYGLLNERVVAAVRLRYRMAVTTEYRTVDGSTDVHRLPRLDAFYLRRPGSIAQWGTHGFRRRVALRHRLRRIRRFLTNGV